MPSSTASSSPTPVPLGPYQPLSDRILRALSHHLSLLHRCGPAFFILGSTFNVYTVSLSPSPSCSCPDRVSPCKHMLFVYLRVLNLSFDDLPLHGASADLTQALARQTGQGVWASPRAIARFHQLRNHVSGSNENVTALDGGDDVPAGAGVCPVCLEEMSGGDVARCGTCRNGVHAECFRRWRRIRGRGGVSCVVCRARWPRERKRKVAEEYLNLAGYLGGQDDESDVVVCI